MTVPPGDGAPEIDNFDLGTSDEEVERFVQLLASVPVDTVLAMGTFRFIGPAEGRFVERRDRVTNVLRNLGARSDPAHSRLSSFAFLCIRRPQGFVPLAEAFSRTRGVCLPFHVAADRSSYDDHRARTRIDRRRSRPLPLEAAAGVPGLRIEAPYLSGIVYRSLALDVPAGEPARVRWPVDRETPLGAVVGKTFIAHVALLWSPHASLEAVRFRLLLDGVSMGETVLFRNGGDVNTYVRWEELLPADLQHLGQAEIEVERIGEDGPPARVLIGEPTLHAGQVLSY